MTGQDRWVEKENPCKNPKSFSFSLIFAIKLPIVVSFRVAAGRQGASGTGTEGAPRGAGWAGQVGHLWLWNRRGRRRGWAGRWRGEEGRGGEEGS